MTGYVPKVASRIGAKGVKKAISLTSPRRTASKKARLADGGANNMDPIRAAEALKAKGVVGPPADGSKLRGDELLHQYITLESIGAPFDTILSILQVSRETGYGLRRKVREMYISSLSESGVMGTLGTAFHRIDMASQRAMALLATIDDKDPKAMDAARALVAFESQKVELLVRTGAIKVKHKVEISAEVDPSGHTTEPTIMSGEAALRVLRMLTAQDQNNASNIQDATILHESGLN